MSNVANLSPGSAATAACIGVELSPLTTPGMTLSATLGGAGQATLGGQLTMNVAQYNTSGTVPITAGTNTNSGACIAFPATGTDVSAGAQGATLTAWAGGVPTRSPAR